MDLWSHCENPYPFVPAEVLDAADSVRASLPNRYCDPKIAARLFDEVFDEHVLCDDLGSEHRHHRAPLRHQQPLRRQPAGHGGRGAAHEARQDPEPRDAGDRAPGPGPRGRGVCDARRDLEGAAADRVREVGRHRDGVGRCQPGPPARARVGGDRPDREGADLARRAVQLGGRVLHPPARQHLAAPLAAAAPGLLGGHQRPADLRRAWPARDGEHAALRRLRQDEAGVRRVQAGAGRGRPAATRRGPLRLPRRSATWATPTRRRSGSARRSPGS